MSRHTLSDWRRAVYRSTTLTDRTKVLLLFLADHMGQDRRVSIPRHKIAAGLGRSERRITERITEAHDSGWLWTQVRGQKGITAVYQGLFPESVSGTDARPLNRRKPGKFSGTPTSPLNDAETRPLNGPNRAFSGTHGGPTITTADLPGATDHRDVGIDEKVAAPPVVRTVRRGASRDREASA
ncbi:hypothetical protein [Nocardioides zhouii]|uniref:Helix-turn-helix domain-containing protein n=1 Tax=Nocardioides zhouii TaxID=1168729 RepID=A0A4Q2TBL0_9ACTN|nr:hypothetical protein [Nocardioides zhouii]RYC14564.1 hypothetical protein EUA94_00085 [Nocardioides zhouii]